MANGWFGRLRGQTETTPVSKETEVGIPWETYKKLLILGPIGIWFLFIAGWLVWLTIAVNRDKMGAWDWFVLKWWKHFSHWWMIPFILCSLWIASAPTWATIYRYLIETVIKNPPLYGEWDPSGGWWHPFVNWRRRRIENAGLQKTYREKFGRKDSE